MNIKLAFKVERSLGVPTIRIMVDDTISTFDGPCPDNIEFDVPLTIGSHELRITHYGKHVDDHLYDEQGKLVIDKHVHIEQVCFDNVALKEELWDGDFFPVYNPDYVKDLRANGIELPYSIRPNLYLGHNGTWQLSFKYPAIDWLIQKRQKKLTNIAEPDFLSHEDELILVKEYFKTAPDLDW